ncbi:unnamed protein product [Linum trigynum]|uniref:Uncharacterized protein n=1 Tax=Linum trigynum TaxID=586398 RepID=A0AAV2EPW7_9ROSI
MALKVEISRRVTIRPLSPTPANRRFHNLTILDQTTPAAYVPVCLFYLPHGNSTAIIADALKTSLSQTLEAYYPLAGRYKDDALTVECNDEGVEFVEACVVVVGGDMSDALREPDGDRLLALLPCRPRERHVDSEGKLVLLAVQLNFFGCGGVAIGICMWHGVADACTLASFLRAWATINLGCGSLVDATGSTAQPITAGSVVVDCTSIFPPTRIDATPAIESPSNNTPRTKIKRFVFQSFQIAALRSGIQSYWQQQQRPTRVQAVSALIWSVVIKIAMDKKKTTISHGDEQELIHRYHVGMMVVNLRPRMDPPLPEQVMGNLVHVPVFAKWPMSYHNEEVEETTEAANELRAQLAEKLRESVGMVRDEEVRKIFESSDNDDDCDKGSTGHRGGYSDLFKRFVEEHGKGNLVAFSSWCRFPFYETDFGWGRPTWVGYFNMMDNLVLLIDGKDGEGIEAWVSLSDEDMYKFQDNYGILQYADFKS